MMKTQYLLSIDQGTTGTTVSLINAKGHCHAKANKEFRQIFPQPGWVEHNPKDIWRSFLHGLKEVLHASQVQSNQIMAIGITNQRETVLAWNRETGEPLGHAIVWQCRRTTDYCRKLKEQGLEKSVTQITGLVLDPYFSGTKMNWILKNHPEAKALAQKGKLCFGTIDTYLIWKLTGGREFVTDVSNASRTLLMDLKTLDYSDKMLDIFSLKREMLPQIRPSNAMFGKTVRLPELDAGIPISGVLGDQQAALFGQKCFQLGEAKITYGTGSFLLMNTKHKPISSQHGLLTTVAWQLERGHQVDYALEGGAFICGAAVQWLRDNLGFIKGSHEVERLAKKVDDSGGVIFVPAFAGLGAPFWDPQVRGSFFGISRGTRREHIARATLEAMALQNVDVMQTMIQDSKVSLKKVRVDGGASANNLLMQLQSDFIGVKVVRPKNIETTSLGAALMAGLGIGLWSGLSEIKKIDRVDKEFVSQISPQQRKAVVSRWHSAIASMQSFYSTPTSGQ
jgi:glycerol kinase